VHERKWPGRGIALAEQLRADEIGLEFVTAELQFINVMPSSPGGRQVGKVRGAAREDWQERQPYGVVSQAHRPRFVAALVNSPERYRAQSIARTSTLRDST
jgi:hypothetical protein